MTAQDEIEARHDKAHEYMDAMSKEKWAAHAREHAQIAAALVQYKMDSNEWRGSLQDLRSTFMSRDIFDSRHDILSNQVDVIEKRVSFFEDREKGARGVLDGSRALIVTAAAVITTIITIILFLTHY